MNRFKPTNQILSAIGNRRTRAFDLDDRVAEHKRVNTYRVGNDQDVSLGGSVGGSLGKITDDGGVGVEQVVTGHARLAGNTGGNENDLRTLQAFLEAGSIGVVASDGAVGVDVAQVGSDTC